MLTILAIETSSEIASCALLRGDSVISRVSNGVRTHSQAVLPMVQELLAEAGITLQDCDAVAFGAGPGSFTGVRTACGIAQGLAFGGKIPAVPVVTLDAMALACRQRHGAEQVLAVLDARMGEVYWGAFEDAEGFAAVAQWPEAVTAPAVLPEALRGALGAAAGRALAAYPALPTWLELRASACLPEAEPHALDIAQLAAADLLRGVGWQDATAAQPVYLRNQVAQMPA